SGQILRRIIACRASSDARPEPGIGALPARRDVLCVAFVAGAAVLYAARYWFTWDRFIGAHRDEALWLPLAMYARDPSLFATDPLIPGLARVFPRAWGALAAWRLAPVGHP